MGKNYSAFTVRNKDGSWVARVVRRKTTKGSVVERERTGSAPLCYIAKTLLFASFRTQGLRGICLRSGNA